MIDCEVRLSLIFLGPEFFWNLNAFEKAKLGETSHASEY